MATEERTEPATPRRRQESRKKGQVSKSAEVGSALIMLSGFTVLLLYGPSIFIYFKTFMKWIYDPRLLGGIDLSQTNVAFIFTQIIFFCIRLLAPFGAVLIVVGLLANISQVGFLFSFYPLNPNFAKLNPLTGFKRLFSMRSVQELLKNLFKIGIVGTIGFFSVKGAIPAYIQLMDTDLEAMVSKIALTIVIMALKVALALIIIAILDYTYQRYEFEKSIKMTKQEVKDEWKQREGDPLVRSRIRQRQREIAMMRMMKEVPRADVVITNPVFLAVALRYVSEDMHAPQVVAKGAGDIAERIREIAEEHNVPIVVDRALAQALFKLSEVGEYVPASLFKAVAEVLAYVYRLGTKAHSFGL
ncbi:MAG: flagellar biosynthesis protein FlhB [bacterium]